MMQSRKAQGTIEYLVIIGVVVVISLAVVGLTSQTLGQLGSVSESSAKAAWNAASPFAIIEWAMSTDGILTVVFKNTSSEIVAYNSGNVSSEISNSSALAGISPGQTFTRTFDVGRTFSSGEFYSYPRSGIVIDYNGKYLTNKIQNGASDIVGKAN